MENIRALLGAASPYSGTGLRAHMGPYERSLVSRPEAGTRGVVLADVLSIEDSALLGGPSDSILLSADELGAVYDSGIRVVPYMDEESAINMLSSSPTCMDLVCLGLWGCLRPS